MIIKERKQIKGKRTYSKIEFLDSLKFFNNSISNMGKELGLPKLESDYDWVNPYKGINDIPQKDLDYLERDLDILRLYLLEFEKIIPKDF